MGNGRNENESYEDFRTRIAKEQIDLNIYLNGKSFIEGKEISRKEIRNFENRSKHHGNQSNIAGKICSKRRNKKNYDLN